MKRFSARGLIAGDVHSFALRKGGIEQHVALQVVGEEIDIAVEPFAPGLPKLVECSLPFRFEELRRLVDKATTCVACGESIGGCSAREEEAIALSTTDAQKPVTNAPPDDRERGTRMDGTFRVRRWGGATQAPRHGCHTGGMGLFEKRTLLRVLRMSPNRGTVVRFLGGSPLFSTRGLEQKSERGARRRPS